MEFFFIVLGLIIMYTWVHTALIVIKKTPDATKYENVVMIIAAVTFILYFIGTM